MKSILFVCPDNDLDWNAGGINFIFIFITLKATIMNYMPFIEGYHTYYVYIITNKNKTVLYTGVTNNLRNRLQQHWENTILKKPSFASKYNVHLLLYYEQHNWIQEAIAREKEIKGWRREKKIELIKTINPKFKFLNSLFGVPPASE